ncbi:hypothetical protein HK405_005077 [Cladochytrium tenue]|nr:hypothetical protein HK405_005077 [Cladochytrium tenue]
MDGGHAAGKLALVPWVLLTRTDEGLYIRYSIFSCSIKMAFTAASDSENMATINPVNRSMTQQEAHHEESAEESDSNRRVHLRFELPDTAPQFKDDFKSGDVPGSGDYQICVNLESDFAKKFFGLEFMEAYENYVKNVVPSLRKKNQRLKFH